MLTTIRMSEIGTNDGYGNIEHSFDIKTVMCLHEVDKNIAISENLRASGAM